MVVEAPNEHCANIPLENNKVNLNLHLNITINKETHKAQVRNTTDLWYQCICKRGILIFLLINT